MMRSMHSVIAGLRNHQLRMDVIGNNIANVNTCGFKKGRVVFKDTLYQTIRTGSAPQDGRGGTNQMAVGLGMEVGSIDTICTPGASQGTGKITDLCINGNGYFAVRAGDETFYTRSGAFDFDTTDNFMVSGNGALVLGWMADPDNGWAIETESTKNNPEAISIAHLRTLEAKASTYMNFTGNLDFSTELSDGDEIHPIITSKDVFDSRGETHTVSFRFIKTGADAGTTTWEYKISFNDINFDNEDVVGGTLTFDANGRVESITPDGGSLISPGPISLGVTMGNGADDLSLDIDLSKLTEYKGTSTAWVNDCDGYRAGELKNISIDSDGIIRGAYSNEISRNLAQIALVTFQNPAGLTNLGESLYRPSSNSGAAKVGFPGEDDKGMLIPGNLEMSNVDLSEEFVDMITTQRGFQASSRVITTSDEMLQELVNLKR